MTPNRKEAETKLTTSPTRRYSTQQVAKQLGIHKSTLLEWLEKGFVPEPGRDWRGWRVWTEKDIEPVLAHKNKPRPSPIPRSPSRRPRATVKVHS